MMYDTYTPKSRFPNQTSVTQTLSEDHLKEKEKDKQIRGVHDETR